MTITRKGMGIIASAATLVACMVPASAYADSTFGTDEGTTAGTYAAKVSGTTD